VRARWRALYGRSGVSEERPSFKVRGTAAVRGHDCICIIHAARAARTQIYLALGFIYLELWQTHTTDRPEPSQ